MRFEPTKILIAAAVLALAAKADDPPTKPSDEPRPGTPRRSLEDVPEPFVPLKPRTTEDQSAIEAVRLFASARALEDRHRLTDAIDVLEKARQLQPDSPAILRRLSRLNLVLGRTDAAVAVARRLLEIDPGDSASLALLVGYFLEKKGDPGSAEALMKSVAADPKLDKGSAGYYLVLKALGDLYADVLNKPSEASDAYAKLIEALDSPAANKLSPQEKMRVTDGDEASAYAKIGEVFLKAGRGDAAVQAFRKGLIYREDHPTLPRQLAQAFSRAGKNDEALAVLEPFLKRQPAGSEPYEILGEILESGGRSKEFLPRLEQAAAADPKNIKLQFLLAVRYRAEGQAEKADALLAELLKDGSDPQAYAALAQSYKSAKRADDLVRVLGEALSKPGGFEAVRPTIESLADDPDLARKALDAGLKMMQERPPTLSDDARKLLAFVAGKGKHWDNLVAIDRAAIDALPTPQNYKELAFDLYNAQRFDDAAGAIGDLFAKHPAEKTAETMITLARCRYFGGKIEPALEAAKEARLVEPNSSETLLFLGFVLSQLGRDDEAIAVYEDLLKRAPANEDAIRRGRSGLSSAYVNKGDFARGEAELEILLRQNPEDAGVNNDLGYLYADQGKNLDRAEEMIRKALEEEPTNGSYLDSLGWVLFKQGKLAEAVEPLVKAADGDRADVTICDHLGDVYFRLKEFAKAKEYWTKAEGFASKTTPPDKKLAEIRKKLAELDALGGSPKANGPGEP